MSKERQLEVLSPAGDFERLRTAVQYGADAVYLAGKQFGMRASQANFSEQELKEAVKFCHAHSTRVYLTVNILPHNAEIEQLPRYLELVRDAGVDAVIVSDIGTLAVVKRTTPELEIHISTQNGIVNYETACMLYELGAKRVVLARELSLAEIAEIRSRIECVKNRFDLLTDPDLIDACIYEMEGLERRYGYLLKRARTLGIKNQKIGALETYPAEMAP